MKMIVAVLVFVLAAPAASGHCDWVKGPVVGDARAALATGDLAPVLKWVTAADEPEVRRAFARTVAARAAGGEARELADQWFFETVVRIHRASEGETFTGLKPEDYRPERGIEMADHALEASSLAEVERTLGAAMKAALHERFTAAVEAKKHAGESAAAGRHFVRTYAEFVHFVEELHRSVSGGSAHKTGPADHRH